MTTTGHDQRAARLPDSLVSAAAMSLSPHAVLTAQWRRALDRLTELCIQLHNLPDESDPDRAEPWRPSAAPALRDAIDTARLDLSAIEDALERLAHRTYGRCESCGRAIDQLRLISLPAAQTCRRCRPVGQVG